MASEAARGDGFIRNFVIVVIRQPLFDAAAGYNFTFAAPGVEEIGLFWITNFFGYQTNTAQVILNKIALRLTQFGTAAIHRLVNLRNAGDIAFPLDGTVRLAFLYPYSRKPPL